MQATITRRFGFEAMHCLENHDGECAREHGHSYHVEVVVQGPIKPADGAPDEGMVCDFGQITAWWEEHCRPHLQHHNLNKRIGSVIGPTTAENIAVWIMGRMDGLTDVLAGAARVECVTVWETERGAATVHYYDLFDGS